MLKKPYILHPLLTSAHISSLISAPNYMPMFSLCDLILFPFLVFLCFQNFIKLLGASIAFLVDFFFSLEMIVIMLLVSHFLKEIPTLIEFIFLDFSFHSILLFSFLTTWKSAFIQLPFLQLNFSSSVKLALRCNCQEMKDFRAPLIIIVINLRSTSNLHSYTRDMPHH